LGGTAYVVCGGAPRSGSYPHFACEHVDNPVILAGMKLFMEGSIGMIENASFKDAKTGETVPYFKIYVQNENNETIALGSRENFEQYKGKDCVFELEPRADFNKPSLFRLKILACRIAG